MNENETVETNSRDEVQPEAPSQVTPATDTTPPTSSEKKPVEVGADELQVERAERRDRLGQAQPKVTSAAEETQALNDKSEGRDV